MYFLSDKPLTKKQLEDFGFEVNVKKLKTKTNVVVTHPNYHLIDLTFYYYPTFYDIIKKVESDTEQRVKNTVANNIFKQLF